MCFAFSGGPPLADDFWHVGDYYENIRNKLKNLDPEKGACYKMKEFLPERMCKVAMKVRATIFFFGGGNSTFLSCGSLAWLNLPLFIVNSYRADPTIRQEPTMTKPALSVF